MHLISYGSFFSETRNALICIQSNSTHEMLNNAFGYFKNHDIPVIFILLVLRTHFHVSYNFIHILNIDKAKQIIYCPENYQTKDEIVSKSRSKSDIFFCI